MKNNKTLYTVNGNKHSFTGEINPNYDEDQILLFDSWNVNEIQTTEAPEGINLTMFKAVSAFLGIPTPKTIKRIK